MLQSFVMVQYMLEACTPVYFLANITDNLETKLEGLQRSADWAIVDLKCQLMLKANQKASNEEHRYNSQCILCILL